MSGALQSTEGSVARNPKVRMATFSQHHMDGLDLAVSPLTYMLQCFPGTKEQQHRCAASHATVQCHWACCIVSCIQ